MREDDIRRKRNHLGHIGQMALSLPYAPAVVDAQVSTLAPAQFGERLQERGAAGTCLRIVRSEIHKYPDAPHLVGLLRTRRERPSCRRATEKRYEIAAVQHTTLH